jgi:hypothetical protein
MRLADYRTGDRVSKRARRLSRTNGVPQRPAGLLVARQFFSEILSFFDITELQRVKFVMKGGKIVK